MKINFMILVMLGALVGLEGSGFRLSEQSLNGTALNSAYVAGAKGADSSYYNPANMGLSEEAEIEVNGTLILVPGFDFTTANRDEGATLTYEVTLFGKKVSYTKTSGCAQSGACSEYVDGVANTSVNIAPKIFLKSKAYKPFGESMKVTFGASMTTPSGLAMDWDGQGGSFLDDVSIMMIELNPVASISFFNDVISIGGGWRAIYAGGDFNNTLYVPYTANTTIIGITATSSGTTEVVQKSSASDWGYGWNAGLTIKPRKDITLAATYRSKVEFAMSGSLSAIANIDTVVSGTTAVEMTADLLLSVDMPEILAVAVAKDFGRLKAEFVYERTFWSRANIFEFGYSNQVFTPDTVMGQNVADMMSGADYDAVAMGRGWKDSSAYRLGFTYTTDKATLMLSGVYDETPVPQGSFGIPDCNAWIGGVGARYKIWRKKLDVGVAYSAAFKDNRQSFIQSKNGWGQLHLLTFGAKYIF